MAAHLGDVVHTTIENLNSVHPELIEGINSRHDGTATIMDRKNIDSVYEPTNPPPDGDNVSKNIIVAGHSLVAKLVHEKT